MNSFISNNQSIFQNYHFIYIFYNLFNHSEYLIRSLTYDIIAYAIIKFCTKQNIFLTQYLNTFIENEFSELDINKNFLIKIGITYQILNFTNEVLECQQFIKVIQTFFLFNPKLTLIKDCIFILFMYF